MKDAWEKQREAWKLLIEALKNDPDPFVRACLRENPGAFSGLLSYWKPRFLEATHMERLALTRNPEVGEQLIEKVFDPEETELGIDMEARSELARAFLSNEGKLHKLTDDAGLCPDHKGYWEARIDAEKFLATLWRLALKWPEDSDIPVLVFRNVPADGLSKAEAYRACSHRHVSLRFNILDSCGPRDDEVVRLGLQDADGLCREWAFLKLTWIPNEWIEAAIERKDKVALKGLADNDSLSIEDLRKIQECLNEIEPGGLQHIYPTIERKQSKDISQDPKRLVGNDGRGLLEEKINFIGQTLVEARARTEGLTQKPDRALVWARIGAVASVLILLYLILR